MSERQPIRVLIADDQELVRAGFAMVIESQDDMHVAGQASDGDEAVALAGQIRPDVVLMDVRMPGMDGIEATRRIVEAQQETESQSSTSQSENSKDGRIQAYDEPSEETTKVIILTTFDLDEYVMSAINAGASGFLLKDTEPETLLASIRTVYQGNAIIAPSATKRLIEKMSEQGRVRDAAVQGHATSDEQTTQTVPPDSAPTSSSEPVLSHPAGQDTFYTDPELDDLTDREREVLIEVAHGLSNQEISDKLFISMPTVKTHVAHVLSKIHARNRVQAVVFAYDNHLV